MRRQLPRVLTTRTSVDRERPKAERKQLLAEVGEQIKALANVELPKLDAAMVTPDGHAALFASLTGLKTELVQLSFAIFTAVLAIFAKSITIFFSRLSCGRARQTISSLRRWSHPSRVRLSPSSR